MRLKNQNPRNYIGRTIIFRHQAWQIDGVDSTHVLLSKPGLQENGLLLGYAGLTPAQIRTGTQQLASVLESFRRGRTRSEA